MESDKEKELEAFRRWWFAKKKANHAHIEYQKVANWVDSNGEETEEAKKLWDDVMKFDKETNEAMKELEKIVK